MVNNYSVMWAHVENNCKTEHVPLSVRVCVCIYEDRRTIYRGGKRSIRILWTCIANVFLSSSAKLRHDLKLPPRRVDDLRRGILTRQRVYFFGIFFFVFVSTDDVFTDIWRVHRFFVICQLFRPTHSSYPIARSARRICIAQCVVRARTIKLIKTWWRRHKSSYPSSSEKR